MEYPLKKKHARRLGYLRLIYYLRKQKWGWICLLCHLSLLKQNLDNLLWHDVELLEWVALITVLNYLAISIKYYK